MTEDEKRRAGVLFFPGDPELKEIKRRTHNLNLDYNATYEDEVEKRAAILAEILGDLGEGSFFQGPITFHYGKHTHIGKRFFGNFNLTVQDDADVYIGDDCNFGPNVTIVTPLHPMVAAVLGAPGAHRESVLVRCRGDRLSRRHGGGRLCDWGGQCRDAGHSCEQLCRRRTLPRHPPHHRGGQHEVQTGHSGGQHRAGASARRRLIHSATCQKPAMQRMPHDGLNFWGLTVGVGNLRFTMVQPNAVPGVQETRIGGKRRTNGTPIPLPSAFPFIYPLIKIR